MIVSNERLEELESKCTGYLAWLAKNSDTLDEDTADFLSVLTELKSIRQAATAGVEEAANKLVRFVEANISEHLPGEFALPDDDAQVVRDFLAALLAPRDAALNEIAVVWSRVALLSSQIPPKVFEELNAAAQIVERVLKTGALQPTIAERDAVLRECRAIVQDRHDAWVVVNNTFPTERAQRDRDSEVQRCVSLLARIDALTKGVGDGNN